MPVASMKELREREDLKDKMTSDGPAAEGGIPREAMERPVDGERLPTMFHGLYHEKQIGALCAVHAMNNLVQERRFDEVELAAVAHRLDDAERALLGGQLGAGQDKGDSTSLQRECFARARSGKKHPRFETVPRDDRSSKNQPKRVEIGRARSL